MLTFFTEQGIATLSGILNSKRAILVNIAIMRVFARVKNIFSNHKELAEKFRDLERSDICRDPPANASAGVKTQKDRI